jgi:GNAT superfamily N-acetyltransferase
MTQVDIERETGDEEIQYLTVRKATPADFPAIREVARTSRAVSFKHFMTEEEVEDEVETYYNDQVLNGILSNPANAIFVAEKGDTLTGYCSVLPKDRRGRPRLLQFYVRPEAQRQGVGELLFERGRSFLKDAGCTEMYISTLGENMMGRKFFEKRGCKLLQEYESVWDGSSHLIAVYYLSL